MPETTADLGVGKITYTEPEQSAQSAKQLPKRASGMKRSTKILLSALAAVVLIGLIVGGIIWSRSGVVVVQTGKVARQDLTAIVTASGQIKPPPEGFANVNANSFGRITDIYVKEGDHVKKGQVLLRTESVQQEAGVAAQEAALKTAEADAAGGEATIQSAAAALKTAQADLESARAKFDQAKADYARSQELLKDSLIAQQAFDAQKSAYQVSETGLQSQQARVTQASAQYQQTLHQRDMTLARITQSRAQLVTANDLRSKTIYTAPFDASVTSLPVHVGENVVPGIQNQTGSVLFQVSNLTVITAEVMVDETDIVNVKLGQPAEVTIDAIPNKTFKGRVTEIGQSAVSRTTGQTVGSTSTSNEEAKDFKVVVTLDDPPTNARPGLSTTAKITTATRQNAVTIPIQALTIRTRRELEDAEKASKGKALAADKQPTNPTASGGKDRGKEELQGVFAVRGGKAVFVPVEIGIMGVTDVEIVKGLQPGDDIVTGSYQVLRTLKSNTKVKIGKAPTGPGQGPSPS